MMIENFREDFEKAFDHLVSEVATLRIGRATPGLVEGIIVDAYNMKQPIRSVATITIQDAKNILVEPWDKSIAQAVETAIRNSDIGVNPVSNGVIIRIPLPDLTQDRRTDLIKVLHKKLEASRIAVRQIREDVRNEIEKAEKRKELSEDDRYVHQEELEALVKEYNLKIKALGEKKEIEINTI